MSLVVPLGVETRDGVRRVDYTLVHTTAASTGNVGTYLGRKRVAEEEADPKNRWQHSTLVDNILYVVSIYRIQNSPCACGLVGAM